MKKKIVLGLIIGTMAVGTFAVNAADTTDVQDQNINKDIENGTMNEIQIENRKSHFEEMDKYHEENGFRGGHCHDRESGRKYGRGMMGKRNNSK